MFSDIPARDRKNDYLFYSVQSNDYVEQMLWSELADDVDGMKSQCCKWNEGMVFFECEGYIA